MRVGIDRQNKYQIQIPLPPKVYILFIVTPTWNPLYSSLIYSPPSKCQKCMYMYRVCTCVCV